VRCEGNSFSSPLLLACTITSSGGDAVHVKGMSSPLLQDCVIQVGEECGTSGTLLQDLELIWDGQDEAI
jgi:hypothetical protein